MRSLMIFYELKYIVSSKDGGLSFQDLPKDIQIEIKSKLAIVILGKITSHYIKRYSQGQRSKLFQIILGSAGDIFITGIKLLIASAIQIFERYGLKLFKRKITNSWRRNIVKKWVDRKEQYMSDETTRHYYASVVGGSIEKGIYSAVNIVVSLVDSITYCAYLIHYIHLSSITISIFYSFLVLSAQCSVLNALRCARIIKVN